MNRAPTLSGFLLPLFLAAMLVVIFKPLHEYLMSRVKQPMVAALMATILVVVIVFVPMIWSLTMAANEAISVAKQFDANRVTRQIQRIQVMLDLDLSIFSWDIISRFVAKGFVFSIQLTLVAMTGGIVFGTVLALMRLSGRKWLDAPAAAYVNGMRSIPLVMVILWFFLLIPFLIGRSIGAELSAFITFVALWSAAWARPPPPSARAEH